MSSKLTKDKLDLLIEQVLLEKSKFPFNPETEYKDIFGNNYRNAEPELGGEEGVKLKIKALSSQDEPKNSLTPDDFDELPDDDEADAVKAARAIQAHGRNIAIKKVASSAFAPKPKPQKDVTQARQNLPSATLLSQYGLDNRSKIKARKEAAIKALENDSLVNATKLINFLRAKYGSIDDARKGEWSGVYSKYKYFAGQKRGTADYEKALKDLESSLTALGSDETPLTRPNVQSQAAVTGKFAGEIISSFDRVFDLGIAANTLTSRVNRIGEISKAMMSNDPNAVKNISFLKDLSGNELKRATLTCVMVLDYVAAITKYFDNGSGAYLFEAFCALITGGRVIGKGMEAGDFKIQTQSGGEVFGSSKYYQAGSTMSQALAGFPIGENVTYIVAQKADTSDPDDLVNIGIHIGEVKIEDGAVTSYKGNLEFYIDKGELKIKAFGNPTAVVKLAKDKNTSFRESLQNTMDATGGDLQEAFNMFKEFLQLTAKTDELTKKYIDDGETTTGNDALSALEEADLKQTQLLNAIRGSGQAEVDKIGSDKRELGENKTKSKKELDKLIERVILDKMNKL